MRCEYCGCLFVQDDLGDCRRCSAPPPSLPKLTSARLDTIRAEWDRDRHVSPRKAMIAYNNAMQESVQLTELERKLASIKA